MVTRLPASFIALAAPALALADVSSSVEPSRWDPIVTAFRDLETMTCVLRPSDGSGGGLSASCPQQISAHTNSSFTGGSYTVQAGFAEDETAAVSFTLPADKFPLRIDLAEAIFATSNASVQTTTQWSLLVWEGTPASGNLVYTWSSDGTILPHIVLPPGTGGVNVQVMVDPGDPEQMYIYDNGSHTFSIGYRIDQHNNQTQNPCLVAPPTASNAFPTTDVGGLQVPTGNWLGAVDCGFLGCPEGFTTFAALPSYCRPSGDWVMRVTWTPLECAPATGACCLASGACQQIGQTECDAIGGSYQGDNSTCAGAGCAQPTVPCCFAATGGCLDLSAGDCTLVGGVPGPPGSPCSTYTCFPEGACCLANGSCVGPVSPEACAAQGGVFQGDGTLCSSTNCPMPTGAACFTNGACLVLTEAQANAAGASWQGAGTNCVDADADGIADACESGNPADLNGDGVVNGSDLAIFLGYWGTTSPVADLNGSGTVEGGDLSILLGHWG